MRKYIVTMLNVKGEKETHTVISYTVSGAVKEAHRLYGAIDVVDVKDMAE